MCAGCLLRTHDNIWKIESDEILDLKIGKYLSKIENRRFNIKTAKEREGLFLDCFDYRSTLF